MINIKITKSTKSEDFVAVERDISASTIPSRHIFAIVALGIISVLLALPFGSVIPVGSSPFTAFTHGRLEQNRIYEQEYLKINEDITEANLVMQTNNESLENYDDDINTEALIAESSRDFSFHRELGTLDSSKRDNLDKNVHHERQRFTASGFTAKSDNKDSISDTYLSSALTPQKPSISIDDLANSTSSHATNGKWYEKKIKRGDTILSIFNYLNLKSEDLKQIQDAASDSDLNLIVGKKIHFYIDDNNNLLEMAITKNNNKQIRIYKDDYNNKFLVVNERVFAQFGDSRNKYKFTSTALLPSFIQAEKEREQERLKKESLLIQKKKAEEEQHKKELLAQKEADAKIVPKYNAHNRPRLILGTISSAGAFDREAKILGLTNAEIVTIKTQCSRKFNINRLKPGDTFKILFNGVGQGSSMTAISINSRRFGRIDLYRHPQTHVFYEENGYNPSSGSFRRFPLAGQIKVNSPFNLRRLHPIKHVIRPHYGVDFKVSVGTPIYAPADGIVTYAKYMRGGGYSLIINHNGGYTTVYMHLSKFDVHQGDHVHIGQMIGKAGNTGNSTGAHLHYEVHVNGSPVDPLKVDLPTGNPQTAMKLRETFKNTVKILKTDLNRITLAEVR